MARKPSTQPRKKTDDGSLNALFGGAADPSLDTDLQAEADKGKRDDPNATLLAQIAALNNKVEELSKISAVGMQAAPQIPQALKEPVLDLSGLPDPQYDNDAYNKGVAQRTQEWGKALIKHQQDTEAASRALTQDQSQRSESLWNDFKSTYQDHADNEDLVLFASQQVVNRAKDRGLDAEKFMFNNRSQFMKEVADTMDNIRGTPFGKEQDAGVKEEEDESPALRTAGVFGNGTSIPTPREDAKGLAGDMISDLRDTQRKSGFF